ncbi:MAG: MFS transporter [Burkholderiales bacterium]
MPHFPFFFASFAWNYGLGMTWLVIPLYAHAQGLSAAEIGVLFSVPVVAQIAINLVGGAYTDRVGGRLVMLVSCLAMAVSGVQLIFAEGFWMLFVGQSIMVLSRAAFWPANWAIASELPGARGLQVGRLNATGSLAQILGNTSCGFVIAVFGFEAALAGVAALGLMSFASTFGVPARTARPASTGGLYGNYLRLARMPIMYYMLMCGYLSSLPITLSMTFLPILLKEFGHGEALSGVLLALRAIGGIGANLMLPRFISTGPTSRWPIYGGLAVALSVGLLPALTHGAVIGSLLFAVGIGAGIMTLYVQITITESTPTAMRGSALALLGLGWSFSHLTTPLIAGLLSEQFGTAVGVHALGGLALCFVMALVGTRRWAFKSVLNPDRKP